MLSFSIIMPLLSVDSYITWQFNEIVCFHSKPRPKEFSIGTVREKKIENKFEENKNASK